MGVRQDSAAVVVVVVLLLVVPGARRLYQAAVPPDVPRKCHWHRALGRHPTVAAVRGWSTETSFAAHGDKGVSTMRGCGCVLWATMHC